jgi:uncharacterized protein YdhG (YjbR/CyaY superfamily)
MSKQKTIAAYIKNEPREIQARLQQMRKAIKEAAPGAKEDIKWGMPAFSYDTILVMFGAFKKHIGFYPTPAAMKGLKAALAKYKTGRGSVQFPNDKPLPVGLIKRMTKARVKEAKNGEKWM